MSDRYDAAYALYLARCERDGIETEPPELNIAYAGNLIAASGLTARDISPRHLATCLLVAEEVAAEDRDERRIADARERRRRLAEATLDIPWPSDEEMGAINARNIDDARREREARGESD